jgi:altronate hydrolase
VHVHNVTADLFERDYAFATERPPVPPRNETRTFQGYLRPDGRVGTRNYIAVISTVNCSASTSKYIAERFRGDAWRRDFPNVDGVFAITHKGGCGLPFGGPDHQQLERVLAGFANHPNVAAYVIVGLGCEVSFAQHLVEAQDLVALGAVPRNGPGGRGAGSTRADIRPRVLNIQEQGGITRTVEAAVQAVHQLLPEANAWTRTEQPASKINLALECGGSDGNSGVTANPALGVAADLVIAQGGTALLGETTEIYGAEHLLTRRAVSRAVGEKLVERIKWWEWYTGLFGAEINNNPSPGNKNGGLTTIYEKSLGALAKGGSTPLVDVVGYAERVDTPGLVFMDTPGYDPPCTTGLVAGGSNVLVFTTGRGSVLGLKPTPCIKVATNTPMYERMIDDMDLNAGTILEGEPVESAGRRLFDLILEVAGGRQTRSEHQGVGEEEFAPWHIGPTL